MKIAVIVNAFPSVSETFILRQIIGLLQRGHDVDIDAERPAAPVIKPHADIERFRLIDRTHYRTPMPAQWPARLRSAASRMARWGWRRPGRMLDSLNAFHHGREALNLRLLHDRFPERYVGERYDVIHCHFGPNGRRAVEMREVGALRGPIITTFHGYDANVLPRLFGPRLYASLFDKGDLFIVPSEFMRRRIISLGAPSERIVKLLNGADLSQLPFVERRRAEDGTFRILTVGRLVTVKGIEDVLRAIAIAAARCPGLRYVVAGDGPLRGSLQALTAELGLGHAVEFLGAVSQEEVPCLYETAHAFVLASVTTGDGEEDNQPVVLAEAQASGLPVIATRTGGLPECIRAGESGLLVPAQSPEALASAILWLADHPEAWPRMGRAGRAYVEENFDLDKLNDQLVDCYRSVEGAVGDHRRKRGDALGSAARAHTTGQA